MSVAFDLQANGWEDSADIGGLIRTRRTDADVVRVPLKTGAYLSELFGAAGATAQATALTSNPDGSGTALVVSTTTALGDGVRVWFPFVGRCFGVRWLGVSTTPDFTVVVDGEAVRVEGWPAVMTTEGRTNEVASDAAVLTHDNLDPARWHVAQINFVGDTSGAKSWTLFGWMLDRRSGYQEPPRPGNMPAAGTLTASDAAISLANVTASRNLRVLHQVLYTNTDASARTVTIKHGSTVIGKLALAASGTDGCCKAWPDRPVPTGMAIDSTFTHVADAASVVNYQVIGLS